MFPIGDDNFDQTRKPYVNWILVAINILVFVVFQRFGTNDAFLMSFSTLPGEILSGKDAVFEGNLGVTPIPVYGTIFTSMFMHAGFMHILGNMVYLWIFGDNLEVRMGHVKYLVFYLLCGVLASLSHIGFSAAMGKDMYVPSLGASGAISGVLGGYLILFPKNKVRMFLFRAVVPVPAWISLGVWIGMQVFESIGSLGSQEGGGVAYAAHIGGFIAGLLLVKFFAGSPTPSNASYR